MSDKPTGLAVTVVRRTVAGGDTGSSGNWVDGPATGVLGAGVGLADVAVEGAETVFLNS